MGHTKGFFCVYVYIGKFWGLYLTPFSSYPIHLLSSFYEALNELRKGQKMKNTRMSIDSGFILIVFDYFVVLMFSWTSRNSRALKSRRLKDIELFLANCECKGSSMCQRSVGTSSRYNVLLSPRALADTRVSIGNWEKRVRLSRSRWKRCHFLRR